MARDRGAPVKVTKQPVERWRHLFGARANEQANFPPPRTSRAQITAGSKVFSSVQLAKTTLTQSSHDKLFARLHGKKK
jgi:hypothetical protein